MLLDSSEDKFNKIDEKLDLISQKLEGPSKKQFLPIPMRQILLILGLMAALSVPILDHLFNLQDQIGGLQTQYSQLALQNEPKVIEAKPDANYIKQLVKTTVGELLAPFKNQTSSLDAGSSFASTSNKSSGGVSSGLVLGTSTDGDLVASIKQAISDPLIQSELRGPQGPAGTTYVSVTAPSAPNPGTIGGTTFGSSDQFTGRTVTVTQTLTSSGAATLGTTLINGSLTVTGSTTTLSDLNVSGNSTLTGLTTLTGGFTTPAQGTLTKAPTLAHAFTTWPAGTSNISNSSLYINPASAVADGNLIGAAINGTVKFVVDAEGDIYANNLILSGSTSTGATTVGGNLIVQDNTTLGDAGTDTVTINANSASIPNNLSFLNGSVGIGTTNPSTHLEVYDNAADASALDIVTTSSTPFAIRMLDTAFSANANNGFDIFQGGNGKAHLVNNNIDALDIDTVGNVGIGTTNPSLFKLQVAGSIGPDIDNTYSLGSLSKRFQAGFFGDSGVVVGYNSSAAPSGGMIINGNVGIGTTNPLRPLTVSKNDGQNGLLAAQTAVARIINTNANINKFSGIQFGFDNTDAQTLGAIGVMFTDATNQWKGDLVFGAKASTSATDLTEYMRIQAGGNVGIGTTSPQDKLHINGGQLRLNNTTAISFPSNSVGLINYDTNNGFLDIAANSTGGITAIKFDTSNSGAATEKMRIDNLGNVGIGSTNPGFKLDVNGTVNATAYDLNGSPFTTSQWVTSGSNIYYNTGNVGIGTTTNINDPLTINGNIGFTNGPKIKDVTGKLQLQAGGTGTGSTGTGSIYFLDSSGNVKGRVEATSTAATIGTGTGNDGALSLSNGIANKCNTSAIQSNGRSSPDCVTTTLSSAATSGNNSISVSSATGFATNDEVLIAQTTGTGVGNYEFKKISGVSGNTISFTSSLVNSYATSGAQVIRVPNYTNVTLTTSGTTLTVDAWNGTTGGVLAFRANGTLSLASGTKIDVSGLGSSGGTQKNGASGGTADTYAGAGSCSHNGGTGGAGATGNAGTAVTGTAATAGSGGGTGGLFQNGTGGSGAGAGSGGGGGGAYATTNDGTNGTSGSGGAGGGQNSPANGTTGTKGNGGTTYGTVGLTTIFLGSGGGSGGSGAGGGPGNCDSGGGANGQPGGNGGNGGAGGNGGGALFAEVNTINNSGTITAAGTNGANGTVGATPANSGGGGSGGGAGGAGGGGGSGGSLYLKVSTTVTAMGTVTASGGTGGTGGNGGNGSTGALYPGGGGGAGTVHGNGASGAGGSGVNGADAAPGSGGAGGDGRVRCDTPSGSCTTTPTANQNTYVATSITTANGYGTLYIGATNTTSADLAEYYVTGDNTLSAGDVVCMSNTKLLDNGDKQVVTQGVLNKCSQPNDPHLIGVISTAPGLVLGSVDSATGNTDKRQLAISGRVPVKLSTENGPIKIGDYLTSSSIPGVAMKADGFSNVIGMALAPFDGTEADDTTQTLNSNEIKLGTIDMFMNLSFRKLAVSQSSDGSIDPLTVPGRDFDMTNLNLLGVRSITSLSGKWGIDESGTLTAATIKADKAILKKIELQDDVTGSPYCVTVHSGSLVSTAGNCEQPATSPAATPPSNPNPPSGSGSSTPPPDTQPPTDSSGSTPTDSTPPPADSPPSSP